MNMKKIAYLSVFAGLLLTSCIAGDYGIKPADPQTNEQEDAVTFPTGLTATAVSPIDLASVESDSVAIAAYTPGETAVGEFGNFRIVVDETYEFPVGTDMKVPVDSLQNMVVDAYGKRPAARTFKAVLEADVMVGGQATYVTSSSFDVVLTPQAPFISSAYYLIGNMNDWNTDNAKNFQFKHSGKDVYEDPVFTITFTAGADCYWKIIPQSNYDAGNAWNEGTTGVVGVAVDGDTATEGTLVTEKPQAGKIPAQGMYKMTINMIEYTYTVQKLEFEEYIYVPGNHQSWNPGAAPALWCPNFDGVYTGFSNLNGDFKFTRVRGWDSEYNFTHFNTFSTGLSQGDGTNIKMATSGFYYLKADVAAGSLTATQTKTWGIIGPAQAGGWDTDTDMTWNAEKGCWYAAGVTLAAGEMKFRANDAWYINVGGEFGNLVENGGNIAVEAGTYDIELYLERTTKDNAYAVLTKK
jgi:hypothetical protein